jgi:hypothetical protein
MAILKLRGWRTSVPQAPAQRRTPPDEWFGLLDETPSGVVRSIGAGLDEGAPSELLRLGHCLLLETLYLCSKIHEEKS